MRRLSYTAAILCFAVTAVQAAPQKSYKDWLLSCDNLKSCTAMSLFPENLDSNYTSMTIHRDAGVNDNLRFIIDFPKDKKLSRITTDDDAILYINKSRGPEGEIIISDRMAYGYLYKAFRNWSMFKLYAAGQANGKPEAIVSLDGLMATLIAMDEAQGRIGTVTALAKSGPKSWETIPQPPQMLIVYRYRGARTAPANEAFVKAMKKQLRVMAPDCFSSGSNQGDIEAYALDTRQTLVILGCGAGAYNSNEQIYTVTNGDPKTTVPLIPEGVEKDDDIFINTSFDPATLSLHHHYKGRGIGDCGESREWVYNGKSFRLVAATEMAECRGRVDWPVTFRAQVK
jgi:hypothetical protein